MLTLQRFVEFKSNSMQRQIIDLVAATKIAKNLMICVRRARRQGTT